MTAQPIHASSPWLLAFQRELHATTKPLWSADSADGFHIILCQGHLGLWAIAKLPSGGRLACLLFYDPGGAYTIQQIDVQGQGCTCRLSTTLGDVEIEVALMGDSYPLLHWITRLTPTAAIEIPFWPRDLYPLAADTEHPAEGVIHTAQQGLSAGLVYTTMRQPDSGSWLYMQNFSSLGTYNDLTKTTPQAAVGGHWPELGFALPPSNGKMLPVDQQMIISDAYIAFSSEQPAAEGPIARLFLDLYAEIYLALPHPETSYHPWPERAEQTLAALWQEPASMVTKRGQQYLNAYVATSDRASECMVQLSVLCPLVEYAQQMDRPTPLIDVVQSSLPTFFDATVGSVVRWLPGEEQGDVSDENMDVRNMDPWYLYVTLRNLGRLAATGNEQAGRLMRDSLPYAMRVAKHFDYHWPISFNIDTLEIVQAHSESGPGADGESDVAGAYAMVLLQAYDMTGERLYLDEALRAAWTLHEHGFDMPYQYNTTLIGATALLRLWQETGDQQWLDLSHMALAAFVQGLWLWECHYGHGDQYPSFMAMPPQPGAAYWAVFEEACVRDTLEAYLEQAGDSLPAAGKLVLAEYVRNLVHRGWYAFPDTLPEYVIASKARSGQLDRNLSVPMEDIGDGWYKAGTVGQQVYGAGTPFTLVTRHYRRLPEVGALLFCDYPFGEVAVEDGDDEIHVRFQIKGDERGICRLRLIPLDGASLPSITLVSHSLAEITGAYTVQGDWEANLAGASEVTLTFGVVEELYPDIRRRDKLRFQQALSDVAMGD